MIVRGPDTDARPLAPDAPPSAASASAATRPRQAARAPWVGAEPPRNLVVLGAAAVLATATTLETVVFGHIGVLTGLVLVLVSVGSALMMRPEELFTAGVLPPLLTLVLLVGVAVVHPQAVSVHALDPTAGAAQVVIAGFVDLAGALVVAHLLALVLVGLRVRAVHASSASR